MQTQRIKYLFLAGLLFGALWLVGGIFASLGEGVYRLHVERAGQKLEQKISLSFSGELIQLEFFDDRGEKTINLLGRDYTPREIRYFNANGREYMRLAFDYKKKEVISTGLVEESYDIKRDTFDGNGSIFLILAQKRPVPGKRYLFTLLQSKEGRSATMFFEHVGTETLEIQGKKIVADIYETGVESSFLSFFWPYRYRYWYSKDGRFLQYEGPIGHENVELIKAERPI